MATLRKEKLKIADAMGNVLYVLAHIYDRISLIKQKLSATSSQATVRRMSVRCMLGRERKTNGLG